jgi:hypothetical protein
LGTGFVSTNPTKFQWLPVGLAPQTTCGRRPANPHGTARGPGRPGCCRARSASATSFIKACASDGWPGATSGSSSVHRRQQRRAPRPRSDAAPAVSMTRMAVDRFGRGRSAARLRGSSTATWRSNRAARNRCGAKRSNRRAVSSAWSMVVRENPDETAVTLSPSS